MWNCAKECGYWVDALGGCTINYTPEAFLLLCPCFEMAMLHARDPTPADVVTVGGHCPGAVSSVNDQSQAAARGGAVKDRGQIPENRDDSERIGADRPDANPYFSGEGKTA